MTKISSKVTLHLVSSLDGFIVKQDGDVSWMHSTDHYEKGERHYYIYHAHNIRQRHLIFW